LWVVGSSVDATGTLFDSNVADTTGTSYGGGAFVDDDGKNITWTGGEFLGNLSIGDGFAPGGGMVLDATANTGSIVASFITYDGNQTIGPASANTGGGVWTSGAPITLTDILTTNNVSDYGAGTSLNSSAGGVVTLERVEYRGNVGVHAGATDIYDATVTMTDCIIEENEGGVIGGIQYGALLVDQPFAELTVTTSDLGINAEDNVPFDVLVNGLMADPTYNYGDGASFFCDVLAETCI
jgi:hypothetical protein